MHTRFSVVPFGVVLVLGGVLMAGCQGRGQPPAIDDGTFTAHVQGTLTDTLTGAVHYRATNDTVRSFELGDREGSGLSIELEPRAPRLHTYEVVAPKLFKGHRPGRPPGAMAFLTLGKGRFAAVNGRLEFTYLDDEQVGAEFTFQMEGNLEGIPVDDASVEVTGVLNSRSER